MPVVSASYDSIYNNLTAVTTGSQTTIPQRAARYHQLITKYREILEDTKLSATQRLQKIEALEKSGSTLAMLTERTQKETAIAAAEQNEANKSKTYLLGIKPYLEYQSRDVSDLANYFNKLEWMRNIKLTDKKGQLITTDSILFPKPRISDQQKEEYIKAIKEAAALFTPGKEVVFGKLTPQQIQTLEKGMNALRDVTVNMNNYMNDILKLNTIDAQKIKAQKEYLEKMNFIFENRLVHENVKKIYNETIQKELPHVNLSSNMSPQALRETVVAPMDKKIEAKEKNENEFRAYLSYIGEATISFNKMRQEVQSLRAVAEKESKKSFTAEDKAISGLENRMKLLQSQNKNVDSNESLKKLLLEQVKNLYQGKNYEEFNKMNERFGNSPVIKSFLQANPGMKNEIQKFIHETRGKILTQQAAKLSERTNTMTSSKPTITPPKVTITPPPLVPPKKPYANPDLGAGRKLPDPPTIKKQEPIKKPAMTSEKRVFSPPPAKNEGKPITKRGPQFSNPPQSTNIPSPKKPELESKLNTDIKSSPSKGPRK